MIMKLDAVSGSAAQRLLGFIHGKENVREVTHPPVGFEGEQHVTRFQIVTVKELKTMGESPTNPRYSITLELNEINEAKGIKETIPVDKELAEVYKLIRLDGK